MKVHSRKKCGGTVWTIRLIGLITLCLIVMTATACLDTGTDEPSSRSELNRCRSLATVGERVEALDCFDSYYGRWYPSIPEDLRELVIREYLDCLEEASDADARDRCDRDVDMEAEATREAVSIMASVEAYDTRVAQEKDNSPPISVDEQTSAIPAGRYKGTVDVNTWFFLPSREQLTAINANELWIEIAPDGSVTGSLQVDYDTTFEASSGNTLSIYYTNDGTFSGGLQGAEGRIDLDLHRHKESSGTLTGDSTINQRVEIRVEGGRLFGTVEDNYYTFEASMR